MFRILKKTMLCPTIAEIVVEAPRIAKAALPGQFLIIRDSEKDTGIGYPLKASASKGKAYADAVVSKYISLIKDICTNSLY